MKKRILSVLTALALVLTLFPSAAIAAESGAAPDSMGIGEALQIAYLDTEDYPSNDELYAGYIWKMFTGEDDDGSSVFSTGDQTAGKQLSGNAKTVYDTVAAKIPDIAEHGGSTNFTGLSVSVTKEIATQVFTALCFDFPYEMYWRDLGYVFGGTSFAIEVSPAYAGTETITLGSGETMSVEVASEKATAASGKIENAQGEANRILTGAAEKTSNYDKLKYFKDEICKLVKYDHDAPGDGKPYGDPWQIIYVFDGDTNTNVVCEGYSKAFQYLCDQTFAATNGATPQIQCYSVSGMMGGENATGAGAHMWNIVTMEDGKNYLVDVTNCDLGEIGADSDKIDVGAIVPTGRDDLLLAGATGNGAQASPHTIQREQFPFGDDGYYLEASTITYYYDTATTGLYPENILTLATENYATNRKITSIVVKQLPNNITYEYGDEFDPTGLVITVTYDDGKTADVPYENNNMTFDPKTFNSIGNQTVKGSYGGETFTVSNSQGGITVSAKDISDGEANVTVNGGPFTYTGVALTPDVTVKVGDKTLTMTTDYTVAYEANTNAGSATVKVNGNGNYTGTASETFAIAKATPVLTGITVTGPVYTTSKPADVAVSGTAKVGEAEITGTWAFKDGTVFTASQKEYEVVFTPGATDASNCNSANGKVTINVEAVSVKSIAVTGPTKTEYIYGEKLSTEGMTVTVTYNNDTVDTITQFPDSRITFSDDLGDVGENKTITITWADDTTKTCQITGIKVSPKPVSLDGISWDTAGSPFTYDGTEKTVTLSGTIPEGVNVDKTTDTQTDAGTYTASATFTAESGNYTISGTNPITAEWIINKANLNGKNASIHVKFDDTDEKIIASSAFGIKEEGSFALKGSVTGTGLAENYPSFGPEIKIALAAGLTAENKGDITIPVTFTATNTNYNPIDLTLTVSVTDKTVTEVTAAPFEKTYDGSAVTLAELTANLTATSGGEAVAGDWTTADTLPTNAGEYSLTMTFTPTEAEAYTEETVVISVTIKKAAATVTADDKTITAGDPLPEYTWTVAPAGVDMTNTPAASCEATSSSPAGTYPITVTGDEVSADGNYTITYVNGTLTIEAAVIPEPPVIHVTGVSLDQNVLHLTVGGTAQLVASVAPSNAGNRNVTWSSSEPAVAAVSGGAVTALRPGSAVITVTTVDGGYAASCAVTVTAPVTPPVNPGNPGGGYPTTPVTPVVPNTPSNPGSSNNNNNSSTNNPGDSAPSTPSNSSVAPEATVSGGTASAVVSGDMASQLVDQAASGVSTVVIAPEISGSVNRTEVSIPASAVSSIAGGSSAALKVETPAANITISNSGLASLGGQDVTIAAEKTGGTVSVEITAGGQTVSSVTGGLKVEIPADCGPGTVAQLVDENGNVLSTLRKSYASGQTMNVPLEGSAKVIFVDNGKSFADVPAGNWASNAVAFVSGHELMNGVSAASFSPAEPMTRGMLAVVLHNLEGNPGASYSGSFGDVGGNDWYAQAVQWAADNSIVTGVSDGVFAPNASITREQLVVMLYRYAGEPNAGGSLTGFSDSANVSSWARQAMAWAVSSGIVGGSNGSLNPQSGATRAEVAQMLMNFVTTGEI